MIPMSQQVYRTAIAINNMGCSLLDRGCYVQAHQTLTDAAQVMVKLTCDDEQEASGDSTTNQHEEADALALQLDLLSKLQAANQRHALSMLSGPPPPSLPSPTPLRLEPENFEATHTADLYVMSAMAVHNMALSCLCQSLDSNQAPERKDKLQSKAVTLLESSYRLIREGGDHQGIWTPPTIQVAIHILESLAHAIASTDIPEDSNHRKLFTELEGLRSAVRTMSRSARVHLMPGSSGVAPAA